MRYNLYSVRIIRRMDQGAYSIYWQEFFKFSGVYVLDYIVDEVADNSDFSKTDVNLVLTDMGTGRARPKAGMEYLLDCSEEEPGKSYASIFRKDLTRFMNQVDSWLSRHGSLLHIFEQLADIFIEKDYIHFNYYRHSFLKQMTKEEMLETADKYCDCYNALGQCVLNEQREMQPSPYLKFALLNCARKMNDIYTERGNAPMFKQEAMMRAAKEITGLDPDFSMGWVLAGIIALSRNYLWREGTQYLKRAIDVENSQKYVGFVCYCLGHYFEVDRNDLERAGEMYHLLEEIAPDNYRGLFKKGCWELRAGDYAAACRSFEDVLSRMEWKRRSGWIRPQEIEYGYKCTLLIAWIKRVHMGAREDALSLRERAEFFSGIALENSQFAKSFFGNELGRYCEHMEEKIKGYTIDNIVRL